LGRNKGGLIVASFNPRLARTIKVNKTMEMQCAVVEKNEKLRVFKCRVIVLGESIEVVKEQP
jgi:hypothetical protein